MASPLALWDPLSPVCWVLGRLITWGSKRLGTTSSKSSLTVLAFYNALRRAPLLPTSLPKARTSGLWGLVALPFPRIQQFWKVELESWAWSPDLALPEHHVPREQDWGGGGGGQGPRSPRSHPPTPPPAHTDFGGGLSGIRGGVGCRPELLRASVPPRVTTCSHPSLQAARHTPPTPGEEGRGLR